ncbi:ArsR/SmtB family transcription factor [Promicromonospora citrea]|uniref:Putative transcriptional regulator, ArsR family protein n=1 Tax=Promicromonospora citrea TaxID=43677 RepID=A0A8H9L377_9MICO|nr:metalloregulator ArsR/SmtB family transcription factor [Promicromonospora citrea]NNH53884.1 helix-turn-helix transcriptional regulator [Promicromonospora citrea]GGM18735.1 putative transcriptional regulator, ArsR family protein [Promicromonospora citrea]
MATTLPLTDVSPARPDEAGACCSPLVREAADPETAVELARVFKALGDPTRVRLLSVIAAHEGGEACVCDLTEPVGLSQPTVSHHLRLLVDAGLLAREQRGKWAYYSVVPGALDRLGALLTGAAG